MEYHKRIELHSKSYEGTPAYILRRFDDAKRKIVEAVQVKALPVDNHYVLTERCGARLGFDGEVTVLGVSHDIDDADKRLHTHLKEKAEEMARIHNIGDLVDNTKHAPEKLPRGGK